MATVSEAPGISAIEADLPCAICGYNLKGLSPAGTCPECGQAISRTFRFDLTDADPGWLMSQAWTVALLLALCLLNFPPAVSHYTPWLGYGFKVLLAGLNIWACWRLARPDPSAAADEEGSLRRGVMLASVALAGIAAYQWPGRPATPIFRVAPFVVQMAALAVNDALALVLVKRLTRRSGDALLHRAAKGVLWAFPSIQVVYLLLSLTPMGPYFEVLIYGVSIFNCLAQATMLATIFMLGWTFQAVRGLAAGARERRQAVAAQGAA